MFCNSQQFNLMKGVCVLIQIILLQICLTELTWPNGIQRGRDIGQGGLLFPAWSGTAQMEDGGGRTQWQAVVCLTVHGWGGGHSWYPSEKQ